MVLRMRAAGLKADSRRFWIGVALVGLVHTVLIVGFVKSAPRYLGEQDGSQTGISVELVDAADLASLSTVRPVEPSIPGSAPPPSPPSPPAHDAAPWPEPKTTAAPPLEAESPSPQAAPPARKDSP